MEGFKYFELWGSIINVLIYAGAVSGCGIGGLSTPGAFTPAGDLNVEVATSPFQLFCTLNTSHELYSEGLRSDSLFIEQRRWIPSRLPEKDLSRRKLSINPTEEIKTTILFSEILNETTIAAWYNPSIVTSDLLGCRIKKGNESPVGICNKEIDVGYPPLKPENFFCISQNWESLKCTWDEPYNPIKTTYTLFYALRHSYGDLHHCPPSEDERKFNEPLQMSNHDERMRKGNCFLDPNTRPMYREGQRRYKFVMKIKNGLKLPNGTYPDYEIEIDYPIIKHFEIVRPNKPIDVTMAPTSPTSIKVRFRIPHELDHFQPGLNYSMKYRSEFNKEDEWISEEFGHLPKHGLPCIGCEPDNGEDYVILESLLPYAKYTVQIKLLSAVANKSDERMWSEIAEQRHRTLASVPLESPKTALGGFEIVDVSPTERKVLVYWKQILPKEMNGPDFRYEVASWMKGSVLPIDGEPELPVNSDIHVTESYASFPRLSSTSIYKIDITSANSQGRASKTSSIVIPSNQNNQLHRLAPRASTKIVYNDTLFEISWLPPQDPSYPVISYTIFWCLDKDGHDRPYQCEGKLDWTKVGAEHRSINITLPTNHVYQFAVSANSEGTMSSGMAWTTCTVLHNKVLDRLKPVVVEKVEPRRMLISWHLDCSDRVGVVTGYQISYCAIPTEDTSSKCISNSGGTHDMLNLETADDSNHAWISDLEPWTFYKVSVLVKTRGGSSKVSKFSVKRTLPSMPEESVTHLRGYLADRTSVKLDWGIPLKPNGEIAKYEIRYGYENIYSTSRKRAGDKDFKIKVVNANKNEALIEGLNFFSDYIFQVRVCIRVNGYRQQSLCGDTWSAFRMKTSIGASSVMPPPEITFVNQTEVNIAWSTDSFHHGGPITRYEIIMVSQNLQRSHTIEYDVQKNPQSQLSTNVFLDQIANEMEWLPNCENQSATTNLYNFSIRAITFDEYNRASYDSPWSIQEVVPAYCYNSPPVGLIISLCMVASVVVILTFLCLYKCIQWVSDKLKVIKDAEKHLEGELHFPTRSDNENKWRTNGWTEMQTLPDQETISNGKFSSPSKMVGIINFSPTKLASNQSTNANDPMAENLLNDNLETSQKRDVLKRITGGSDTTSGCESGETESLEKDSSVENGNYDGTAFYPGCRVLDQEVDKLNNHSSYDPTIGFNSTTADMNQCEHPPTFKSKDLPRPPKILQTNSNRAYIRSPEHNTHIAYSERQQAPRAQFPQPNTPVNSDQFENFDAAHTGSYLPSNGYTKAVHVNAVPSNSATQHSAIGSPVNFNLGDPHMFTQDAANSHMLPSGYVITGNSLSHPLPTVIPQLNHCNSLSSSTSGVSSNTPSSSQNTNQGNPSNSYVAFSAVCNDDIPAIGSLQTSPADASRIQSQNCQNQCEYRTFPLENTNTQSFPPTIPVAKGYISVAQANSQDPPRNSCTGRSHEMGYSRVTMPEGGSGPPSLSAAYVENGNACELKTGNDGNFVKRIDPGNSWHPGEDAYQDRNLRPTASSKLQERQDFRSSTNARPRESQLEYLKSGSFVSESDNYSRTKCNKNELPSLVISPNNLLVRNLDDSTGSHSSYVGQSPAMQNNYNNHLNVVASLDGDRQSTMV